MAKKKTVEQRLRALERKAGGTPGKKKKRKATAKQKKTLSRLNSFAKTIQKANPSWKRSKVMKEAGVKYRKKYK